MIRLLIRAGFLVAVLLPVLSARADFDAGQRAWDAGDTDEALIQWRAGAAAGERRAMLALGRLYVQGLGVIQDYVEGHKWLNLAASRGEIAALTERDALAAKMTPQQIAAAQERAASWRPDASATVGSPDAEDVPQSVTAAGSRNAGDAQGAETAAPASPASAPVAAASAPPSPPPSTPPPPAHAIREAQTLLAALGHAVGPADGKWGPRSGEAYRAFLRDAGLPAVDRLTSDALREMRRIAARHGATPPPAPAPGHLSGRVVRPVPGA